MEPDNWPLNTSLNLNPFDISSENNNNDIKTLRSTTSACLPTETREVAHFEE